MGYLHPAYMLCRTCSGSARQALLYTCMLNAHCKSFSALWSLEVLFAQCALVVFGCCAPHHGQDSYRIDPAGQVAVCRPARITETGWPSRCVRSTACTQCSIRPRGRQLGSHFGLGLCGVCLTSKCGSVFSNKCQWFDSRVSTRDP